MPNWSIVGDPHTKPNNKQYISELFDELEKMDNDVVITGDLFDTKEVVRSSCFNLVYNRIKASKHFFYILVGNHDWHNLECKEHSLEPLKSLPNVKIIDEPTPMKVENTLVLFIPYMSDLNAFRQVLIDGKDAHIVFIHQDINDFDFGNGMIIKNGIGLKELEDFPLVIGGHIHKFQQKDNLVLIGTPFSHSWGESDQEKVIGFLNTSYLDLSLIPTSFPQHKTLEYDVKNETPLSKLINHKDNWRVILTGAEADVLAFDQAGYEHVKFIERPTIDTGDTHLTETDSNEQKFLTWAVDIKKLDEDTVALGLEILKNDL